MAGDPAKVDAYRRKVHAGLTRLLTMRGIDEGEAATQADAFDLLVDRESDRLRTMDRLGLLRDGGWSNV
jgi:hypothetical protein